MFQSLLSARKVWLGVLGMLIFATGLFYPALTFGQIPTNAEYTACLERGERNCATRFPDSTATATTFPCDPQLRDAPGFNLLPLDKQRTICASSNQKLEEAGKAITNKITGFTLNAISYPIAILSEIVVSILNLLLGVSGIFLNFIIEYTIINAASNIRSEEIGIAKGIDTAWSLIRDLINMSFIFILLYQSIQLILGRDDAAGKVIVKVALVALLINFSMFITQVVVDASNVIATGFYDATTQPSSIAVDGGAQATLTGGLSDAYAQALGIHSLWSRLGETLTVSNPPSIVLSINILISLFLIVTLFVFVAAGIMLLARFIMIIFLMILSPVAFVGYILPGLQQYSDKWWNTLIGQAFFAPIFMIMTWVNLTFISAIYSREQGKGLSDLLTGFVTDASTITNVTLGHLFNFTLIIGMAVASLIISKQVASKGGNEFSKLTGAIGGAALGASAWAGRKTVGKWAYNQSQNEALRKAAETSSFAKAKLRTFENIGGKSFDARNASLGTLGIGSTIFGDMGTAGGTGGYAKRFEDDVKQQRERAERFATAHPDTVKAYNDSQEVVRSAQRTYYDAKTPEERIEARKKLKDAEREVKKHKARVEQEKRASAAAYASSMTTKRSGNLYMPSDAAKEASRQIMDNIAGDKEAQKQQEIADKKDILERLLAEDKKTEAAAFIKENMGPQDFASMSAATLKNPVVLQRITKADLDAIIRKGEMTDSQRLEIGAVLNTLIADGTAHTSIKKLASAPNGALWGLTTPPRGSTTLPGTGAGI